jgi:hypothetical protein
MNFVGPIAPGTTSVEVPLNLNGINGTGGETPGVILGSQGDVAVIAQISSLLSATSIPYQAITNLGVISTVNMPADGVTPLSLAMQAVATGSTIAFDFPATQWHAILAGGNPTQENFDSGGISVEGQPGLVQDGFYSPNLDMLIFGGGTDVPADLVTGQMSYAPVSALPGTWAALVDVRAVALSQPVLPSTTDYSESTNFWAFTTMIDWATTLDTATGGPVAPPLSLPTQLAVSGMPFFDGGSGIGTAPAITWAAPATGTPAFYEIGVYSLDGSTGETVSTWVATFTTTGSAVTLPDGFLSAGGNYAFTISAYASTSQQTATSLASSPYRTSVDIAFTHTASGIFSP